MFIYGRRKNIHPTEKDTLRLMELSFDFGRSGEKYDLYELYKFYMKNKKQ